MKIQHRSPDLIIFESALFRTTTSLIIGADYILLVDPNWLPIELDFIEQTMLSVGAGKKRYLLFTHSDYDHIIGYGKFKHYETIATENFVNSPNKAETLKAIEKFDDEYYVKRPYAIEYPRVDHTISGDEKQMRLGSDAYQFFRARGHNHDGMITFNQTKGILIAGDYLSNVEFPYIYDSVEEYLATLSKFEKIIAANKVTMLISGHGDATSDQQEMMARIATSRQYIQQLIASVTTEVNFDEDALLGQYDFPIIMRQFHRKNVEVAALEYGVSLPKEA